MHFVCVIKYKSDFISMQNSVKAKSVFSQKYFSTWLSITCWKWYFLLTFWPLAVLFLSIYLPKPTQAMHFEIDCNFNGWYITKTCVHKYDHFVCSKFPPEESVFLSENIRVIHR